MNLQNIQKADLKLIIKEILQEDISLFKGIIREILVENQIIVSDEQATRRRKLEQIINENFDKYDDVFKALA